MLRAFGLTVVAPATAALLLLAAEPAAEPAEGIVPSPKAVAMVKHARELLGVHYELGGRLHDREGIDCQGLLFYAAERAGRCGWKSFSVFPTVTLKERELGDPVAGLAPVATAALDVDALVEGDILGAPAPKRCRRHPPMKKT